MFSVRGEASLQQIQGKSIRLVDDLPTAIGLTARRTISVLLLSVNGYRLLEFSAGHSQLGRYAWAPPLQRVQCPDYARQLTCPLVHSPGPVACSDVSVSDPQHPSDPQAADQAAKNRACGNACSIAAKCCRQQTTGCCPPSPPTAVLVLGLSPVVAHPVSNRLIRIRGRHIRLTRAVMLFS
jgi:hypothetical protein